MYKVRQDTISACIIFLSPSASLYSPPPLQKCHLSFYFVHLAFNYFFFTQK